MPSPTKTLITYCRELGLQLRSGEPLTPDQITRLSLLISAIREDRGPREKHAERMRARWAKIHQAEESDE